MTTVQGLAAAVQGIESIRAGSVGVRSLQSWSAELLADLSRSRLAPAGPAPDDPVLDDSAPDDSGR